MGYQIDFLPAGDSNGDAICIRHGDGNNFYIHLTDGGFVDTADVVIEHIKKNYGAHVHIDELVLSHADNDHACGMPGVTSTRVVRFGAYG